MKTDAVKAMQGYRDQPIAELHYRPPDPIFPDDAEAAKDTTPELRREYNRSGDWKKAIAEQDSKHADDFGYWQSEWHDYFMEGHSFDEFAQRMNAAGATELIEQMRHFIGVDPPQVEVPDDLSMMKQNRRQELEEFQQQWLRDNGQ